MSLTFEKEDHVYRWNGEIVPSVTQVLQAAGLSADYADVPAQHLHAAAKIGSSVHEIAARYLKDQPRSWQLLAVTYSHEHPRVELAVRAWASWIATVMPEVLAYERMGYSKLFGYAGTLDMVIRWAGVLWLIDLKCTSQIHLDAWGLQTGGYEVLWNEVNADTPIERRAALHIADGQATLIPLEDLNDTGRFLGAVKSAAGHVWREDGYVYEF